MLSEQVNCLSFFYIFLMCLVVTFLTVLLLSFSISFYRSYRLPLPFFRYYSGSRQQWLRSLREQKFRWLLRFEVNVGLRLAHRVSISNCRIFPTLWPVFSVAMSIYPTATRSQLMIWFLRSSLKQQSTNLIRCQYLASGFLSPLPPCPGTACTYPT